MTVFETRIPFVDRCDALFLLFGVLALVFVNGVFVAAEFAIVRVHQTCLEDVLIATWRCTGSKTIST
jgi:CBS domain containing-hemolysin-like protein